MNPNPIASADAGQILDRKPAAPRGRRVYNIFLTQIAVLALLLAIWEFFTHGNKLATFLFASPSTIGGFLGKMALDGSLWTDKQYVTERRRTSAGRQI